MAEERFLVTGGLGCKGSWVVRRLVQAGIATTVLDRADSRQRCHLVMQEEELTGVQVLRGDITDLGLVERILREMGITHVIHFAALQVPDCKVDPVQGALVNVLGTVNVFEAARRVGLQRVVYASSVAAYGASDDYPERQVPHDAPLKPHTHYGVYKQANEGTAHVYWLENGISSIGIRPYVVYGPGCDRDMTSSPTKAMLAAALGKPYHIPFGGRFNFQYADDLAAAFIKAAHAPFEGAEAFNLPGSVVRMQDVVAAIEEAEPAMEGKLTFDDVPLPFPEEVEYTPIFDVLGDLPVTPLEEGVAATIARFKVDIGAGRLAAEMLG